jgi:opacity protein-like surface antigen
MTLAKCGGGFGVLVAVGIALAPAAGSAEGFFDLYFGAGFTKDTNADVEPDDFDPTLTLDGEIKDDVTPTFGFRGGYWFEGATPFIGLGLDFSYYGAHGKIRCVPNDVAPGFCPTAGINTDLDAWITPITPLLMLRIPIAASEEIPGGRIQPYAAVGPAFNLSFAFSELDDLGPTVGLVDDFEAASLDVGLDARGGIAVQVARHFALFTEYRYTYFKPDWEDEVDDAFAFDFDTDIDVDADIRTHHIVFGGSFRF